jgi:hypothetical protein
MFADQDYVCKLSTAMRFENDPTLQRILEKMRTPGEDRTKLMLTAHEWKVLQSTDIEHGASLEGTEMWHQAGYPWIIVCMAQWVRSQLSAAHHKATLFLCPAKDYIQNVEQLDLLHVRNELIKFPKITKQDDCLASPCYIFTCAFASWPRFVRDLHPWTLAGRS